MRRIAHISDLHFGREDPVVAEALVQDLAAQAPSLVIVSGDLTQRALPEEFRACKTFLDRIPDPKVVIPGNHDIPLYNLFDRFFRSLKAFQAHVSPNVDESFEDAELAVFALNSASATTFKSGRVSSVQLGWLRGGLESAGAGKFKILATHHPLSELDGGTDLTSVIHDGGVELLLAGHQHVSGTALYPAHVDRSVIVVGAGTAISGRLRGEPNSYNILDVRSDRVDIRVRVWEQASFRDMSTSRFRRGSKGWEPG